MTDGKIIVGKSIEDDPQYQELEAERNKLDMRQDDGVTFMLHCPPEKAVLAFGYVDKYFVFQAKWFTDAGEKRHLSFRLEGKPGWIDWDPSFLKKQPTNPSCSSATDGGTPSSEP